MGFSSSLRHFVRRKKLLLCSSWHVGNRLQRLECVSVSDKLINIELDKQLQGSRTVKCIVMSSAVLDEM